MNTHFRIFITILLLICNSSFLISCANTTQLDSLKIEIDSLSLQVSQLQDSICTLKSRINEVKNDKGNRHEKEVPISNRFLTVLFFISYFISLLALLISIKKKTNDNLNRSDTDIDKRLKWLENVYKTLNDSVNGLSSLIKKYEDIIKQPRNIPINGGNKDVKSIAPEPFPKIKYLPMNSGNYFMEMFDSVNERSLFKVTLINEKKGEYDLIDLNRIKSANVKQAFVPLGDTVTLKNAQSYDLKNRGKIEFDGTFWKIVTPLTVNIK